MAKRSMFVGMDVHKESIDVSLAEEKHIGAMKALSGEGLPNRPYAILNRVPQTPSPRHSARMTVEQVAEVGPARPPIDPETDLDAHDLGNQCRSSSVTPRRSC